MITQNCDNRDIVNNKNHLTNFYNYELKILNTTYRNKEITVDEKCIYPNNNFTKIVLEEEINFKEIDLSIREY